MDFDDSIQTRIESSRIYADLCTCKKGEKDS